MRYMLCSLVCQSAVSAPLAYWMSSLTGKRGKTYNIHTTDDVRDDITFTDCEDCKINVREWMGVLGVRRGQDDDDLKKILISSCVND